MSGALSLGIERYLCILPVMFRVLSYFYFDPLLGGKRIPIQLKVALALVISLLILPQCGGKLSLQTDAWTLASCIAGEVTIGIAMGFMVRLVFAGIEMAGQLIGLQIGFGIVNVLDQTQDAQVSLTGQFYEFMALMVFLSINGHHVLLRGLVKSFEILPVMGFHGFKAGFPEFLIGYSGKVLVLVLMMAAPGMVAIFLLNCAIGFMARTFPQMNIFVIGFPITVMAGLILTVTTAPYLGSIFMKFFTLGWGAFEAVLTYMT